MTDVHGLLSDPELGGTSFTVERTVYKRDQEESSPIARSRISAAGCVHPGPPELLRQLPEEDRAEEYIAVYTAFALSLGSDDGPTYSGPDRILWNGGTWRVVRVKPWPAFGFVSALAVRTE